MVRTFLHRLLFLLAPAVGVAGLAPSAMAEPVSVLICAPGGPGSTQDAKERLSGFFGLIKKQLGTDMTGEYHTAQAACDRFAAASPPKVAVFTWSGFLGQREAQKLVPVAELVRIGHEDGRFHVVARKGTTLEALKGKKLLSPHLDEADFLSRVAFDGRIDLKKDFQPEKVASALKAIKSLMKGEAEAILLSQNELQSMKELPQGQDFEAVASSDPVLGIPMVVIGGDAELVKTLRAGLPGLCKADPEVCKGLEIRDLKAATDETYADIYRRFTRP